MEPQTWNEITEQLTDKLMGWVEGTVTMLPNLAIALFIVMLGAFIARFVKGWVATGLHKLFHNRQLADLGAQIVRVGIVLGAMFIALGILQLDKTVTSLLAGVGIVGIALGFAFQDIAANFMSGVLMAAHRPLRVGDMIETNGHQGIVQAVSLRATTLTSFTGETVIVPNKDVYGSPIVNYTHTTRRRVDVECGVSYADDLEEAERLVVEALQDLPNRSSSDDVSFIYTGFGGSSIDFKVRVWLEMAQQPDFLKAKSDVIKRIKKTFDANGVTIPFPIRTMDFGISGGVPLNEMLVDFGQRAHDDAADDHDAVAQAK